MNSSHEVGEHSQDTSNNGEAPVIIGEDSGISFVEISLLLSHNHDQVHDIDKGEHYHCEDNAIGDFVISCALEVEDVVLVLARNRLNHKGHSKTH